MSPDNGFVPLDQAERQRIAESLEETLFVEAGAGTGKTTTLVARIVGLVVSGRATVDGIAAITFTEAAAAELRERVRRALEDRCREADQDDVARLRCLQALHGLEGASIQTLHSFAGALLRERPLEAGLPPAFDVMDEIEADLAFEERWQQWLDRALESSEIAPHVLKALALGLRLDDLRTIATAFHQSYDRLLRPYPQPAEPPRRAGPAVAGAAEEIRRLLPLAHSGLDDPLAAHASRVAALGDRLKALGPETDLSLGLLSRWGKLSCREGNQQQWGKEPGTGKNGCGLLKGLLKNLEELRTDDFQQIRTAALLPLLEDLRSLVLASAEERRCSGKAEFHDLLVWARDLLRDNALVRIHFQRRFSHILIDEFQDTDPIQAEIAFFLAGQPLADGARGEAEADWTRIAVVPGKLFVVGDPKQSIYRFRRADIAALEEVQGLLGGEPIRLIQNFRSQETIVRWVNALFGIWMAEGKAGVQARYSKLAARWMPPPAEPPLGVHWLGGPVEERAPAVRQEEAEAIAALLHEIKQTPWHVRADHPDALRPARYQDLCVLLPTRTGLRALEQALGDAGVPYRVESQSLILGTQDVRELLACLRAIDTPADQVALVAALRSSAFGLSDPELLQFVEDGGQLDYGNPGLPTGPVRDALDVLHRYHQARTWEPPDELIERFVRERQMVEACFGRARPRERWRRLRFVVERARAFARVGGASFRAFLDWMERQAEEGARLVEVPVPETDEDAVRIMTIHAAKGLEFPIVVLAGIGARADRRPSPAVFDRTRGSMEVRVGHSDGSAFMTPGYETARSQEQQAEDAEDVRLMYVAATRAKDHLVVSLFHPARNTQSLAATIAAMGARVPDPWQEVAPAPVCPPIEATVAPAADDAVADTASDRAAWQERRAAVLRAAAQPAALAVTRLAQVHKDEAERGETPHRRGRGGTSLGRAVHAVLQTVDLASGAGLEPISKAQAAAEGIAGRWPEVADLARRALATSVVRRAVASGRYYREVFVGAPLDGGLLEGFVDLLFEDEDGLVLADYKTDALEGEAELEGTVERYELQVGAYALAVQTITGKPVREVVLVFLRPEHERTFLDVEGLVAQARARAEAAWPGVS